MAAWVVRTICITLLYFGHLLPEGRHELNRIAATGNLVCDVSQLVLCNGVCVCVCVCVCVSVCDCVVCVCVSE